jgi:hypothetical protein
MQVLFTEAGSTQRKDKQAIPSSCFQSNSPVLYPPDSEFEQPDVVAGIFQIANKTIQRSRLMFSRNSLTSFGFFSFIHSNEDWSHCGVRCLAMQLSKSSSKTPLTNYILQLQMKKSADINSTIGEEALQNKPRSLFFLQCSHA